jgi:hypothetical protein
MLPKKAIQQYLSSLYGEEVEVSRIWKLGETSGTLADLKGVGYGYPYVIEFKKLTEI